MCDSWNNVKIKMHGNLHMCNSSIFKVTNLHRMMNLKFRKEITGI